VIRTGERIVPGRTVPDRDDVRSGGLAVGSAEHAVAEDEAAALQPLDVGDTTDANHHHVGRQVTAVNEVDARDAIGNAGRSKGAMLASQAGDADAHINVVPFVACAAATTARAVPSWT
jgi:hypothetical protein